MSDNYLGFEYNNKRLGITGSLDFVGFISNSGNDLRFFNTPNFSNEFTEVAFGERTYLNGVTKTNRSFSFNIELDEITLAEYRDFLDWLNPDSEGTLIFDYNTNYGYDVKVSSLSEGQFIVKKGSPEKYFVSISLSFITTHDYAARWVGSEVYYPLPDPNTTGVSLIDNENSKPFISVDTETNLYTFENAHNLKNFFIIEFDENLYIDTNEENPVELVKIENAGEGCVYYSEYGIALDDDGNFLECGLNPKITLGKNSETKLEITVTGDGEITKIYPTSREIL